MFVLAIDRGVLVTDRFVSRLVSGALLISVVSTASFAAEDVEQVVVTGRRISEASAAIGTDSISNTISVTREALLSAPSGISGLKMLESLPGFNVQANDALGLYEFGNSVFVRAFNFQQIGFLLDEIPMGRSDQFGGSPIFRYVDNENLGRVAASQGAGDVSRASYASLGPIVQYLSVDPAADFGVTLAQTIGSDDLRRSFIKVESGEIGGFSGYLSRSKIDGDLWRGPGSIDREHIEAKLRYRFSDTHDLTFQAVYNDFFDYDTPAITKAQYAGTANDLFGRSGRYFAYLGYVPDLPPSVAGVAYSNTGYNQYYQQAINQRTDYLFGLTDRVQLGERWHLTTALYYEDKDGYGVSPEAYSTSIARYNSEAPFVPGLVAPRGLQYGLSTISGDRSGISTRLEYEVGIHTLQVGAWYEVDDYHRTQARYNQVGGNPAGQPLLNEPVHLQRDHTSERDSLQVFVKDTLSLLDDRLQLEVGFKALNLDYEIEGYRNAADYIARRRARIVDSWDDSFLPQVGAVFSVNATDQIFASYSENLALPRGADDVFAGPDNPLVIQTLDAETSKNVEIGYRTNRPTFNAALAIYQTSFENFLQAYSVTVAGGGGRTETFYANVGAVEAYGAELSGVWKPHLLQEKVYFNANLTYNVAEFQDNYATTNLNTGGALTSLPIKGNRLPDNAKYVLQSGVTFEPSSWVVVNLSARYLSSRYSDYLNAEQIGGYTIYNAYVDLGGEGLDLGPVRDLKLRFNVDNLTDKDYLGTITTVVTGAATFRPGPDRTYQATLTAKF
ncbi:TonB-dependent receptor domain-containing protein [Steroidobacter flavus]|uniref:TonB-dependent receptor domain-containing protein n=1 Tax=Steroidobacter flavus TaxID=1842136 RepID=A0ABV8T3B2_9GAMM